MMIHMQKRRSAVVLYYGIITAANAQNPFIEPAEPLDKSRGQLNRNLSALPLPHSQKIVACLSSLLSNYFSHTIRIAQPLHIAISRPYLTSPYLNLSSSSTES